MSSPESAMFLNARGAGSPPSDQTAATEADWLGLPQSTWIKIAILTALFYAAFWPNLRRLWEKTNPFYGEPNWGHSCCVPLIGLYYLYVNRDALLAAKRKPSWLGMVIALGGLLLYGYGIWPGQNDFIKDFGMVVTLFGVVSMLCGWAVMKIAWFPIAFLVCGIPWPGLVYSWVAGPLQQLAANVAVLVLQVTGVKAYSAGTKICVYGHNDVLRTLNVAEACAGLRSLMTFISIAGAVAFLSARPLWEKLIVVLSAIPIAIFCNVMRISGQGLLDHYVSQQLSENFAHEFVGLVMLVPAFGLILAVGSVLDMMFVEEASEVKPAPVLLRRGVTAVPRIQPANVSTMTPDATAPTASPAPKMTAVPPATTIRAVPPTYRSPMRKNVPPKNGGGGAA